MATIPQPARPALLLFCAYARRENYGGPVALGMYRRAGGTIADSVFYHYWRLAGEMPRAFSMEGVEWGAHIAAKEME